VSFRARLAVASAAAVALAILLAAPLVYLIVRAELRSQVDDSLRERALTIARIPLRGGFDIDGRIHVIVPRGPFAASGGFVQYVDAEGNVATPPEEGYAARFELPPGPAMGVARRGGGAVFTDATVADTHVRVISVPTTTRGIALQVARSLAEVDATLHRVRNLLLAVVLAGIGLATGLGLLVAQAALAPVRRLTEATEHVTETGDLTARLDDRGRDELSRLGGSFNRMMEALEGSRRAQRQLVADASHELRTPLTSLRTNIEVLALDRELPAGERERLLSDVVEQLDEMTSLVAELVELARGEQQAAEPEEVRLDLLVADAVERARRNAPGVRFEADVEETTVRGVPAQLDRAVSNLLDNAAKWSPREGVVDVAVAGGEVTVRDRGPGIADADLPHVFERFYRAAAARGRPGSGLGLAIVKQVAERHGGTVSAERPEGGGTRMRLTLRPVTVRQATRVG
jgi:two-component system sensor histidine kinase MprB